MLFFIVFITTIPSYVSELPHGCCSLIQLPQRSSYSCERPLSKLHLLGGWSQICAQSLSFFAHMLQLRKELLDRILLLPAPRPKNSAIWHEIDLTSISVSELSNGSKTYLEISWEFSRRLVDLIETWDYYYYYWDYVKVSLCVSIHDALVTCDAQSTVKIDGLAKCWSILSFFCAQTT
jgi:hypothetical protein